MIYYNVKDVAKFFLSKESMTHKKLQKLLYYAYSWVLVFQNNKEEKSISNKLFESRIEAWTHGPVVAEVYKIYKSYGWSLIPKEEKFTFSKDHPDVIKILNEVYKVYGKLDADDLESLSHTEEPWKKGIMRSDHIITDKAIFDYYFKVKYGL